MKVKERLARRSGSGRIMGRCLIPLLLCLLLAGCRGTGVFDGSRTSDETGFRMAYAILDREETADLNLSAGDRLQTVIAHQSGQVDVTVGQDGQPPIYRGTAQQNAEFTLTIPESGVYHISVTGHRAEGNVSFVRLPAAEQ